MSHTVHPKAYRLGVSEDWNSRWFDIKKYPKKLREDVVIREYITKKMRSAGLERVEIERTGDVVSVILHTSRPGIVIGRGGSGVEIIKKSVERELRKSMKDKKDYSPEIKIEVREIRNPDSFASLVALSVAEQLERRMPFRQAMKRTMERVMTNKEVEGARIAVSGRLGGADMARREWIKEGNLPRSTLRANIDFSIQEAHTTYGVIGVKVWLYKGQKLD